MEKIIKDTLPPRYHSWLDLLNGCKDHIQQHDAKYLCFVELDASYEMSLDFVKARCFEEFIEEYTKLKDKIGSLYYHIDDYSPSFIIVRDIDRILKIKP